MYTVFPQQNGMMDPGKILYKIHFQYKLNRNSLPGCFTDIKDSYGTPGKY